MHPRTINSLVAFDTNVAPNVNQALFEALRAVGFRIVNFHGP